jgi:hypothetical protein
MSCYSRRNGRSVDTERSAHFSTGTACGLGEIAYSRTSKRDLAAGSSRQVWHSKRYVTCKKLWCLISVEHRKSSTGERKLQNTSPFFSINSWMHTTHSTLHTTRLAAHSTPGLTLKFGVINNSPVTDTNIRGYKPVIPGECGPWVFLMRTAKK